MNKTEWEAFLREIDAEQEESRRILDGIMARALPRVQDVLATSDDIAPQDYLTLVEFRANAERRDSRGGMD